MYAIRNFVVSNLRFANIIKNEVSMGVSRFVPSTIGFSASFTQSAARVTQLPLLNANSRLIPSVSSILDSLALTANPSLQQTRSVTKWSLKKGKRKTVKAVVQRFYRLGWGAWIRPMVGRHKHHWRKNAKRKIQAEKHVFCNATQSTLLDKMVTKYWRKRRFYIDDIYEPYHKREEFPLSAVKPH